MQLIDSHCHLDFPAFDADRPQLLATCAQRGIHSLVLAGVTRRHWDRLWQLACLDSNPRLFASLGLHPCFLAQHQPEHLQALEQQLEQLQGDPRLCALGEIGLDFYHPDSNRTDQTFYLEQQLQLALHFDLPVILHVRKAHAEMLALLKQHRLPRGGIVHAFGGSLEQAREYVKLGFLLGIGGAYTWPNARKLRTMLAQLPPTAIALETDSPDMPPAFAAGERNSPLNLPAICTEVAGLMGLEPVQLARQSSLNVSRLLRLPA